MTATTLGGQRLRRLALADPATYRTTAHLLLDLPIGIATFTIAVTLLSTSAALAITLIGLPLLALTLVAAQWMARFERARIRTLLRAAVPAPAASSARSWRRLADPAAWRAVAYAIVMLPLGIVTSVTTITGWATGAALFAFPAYKPFLDASSYTVGSHNFGGPGVQVAAALIGAVLLVAMPALQRGLAAMDITVVRRLLGART